jgi:hypothetical protein
VDLLQRIGLRNTAKLKDILLRNYILNADDNLFDSPIPHWGKLGIMRNFNQTIFATTKKNSSILN